MGTYMIKCKRMEGTSVTEVSQIGVQTRDRSLALATEKSQEKQRRTVTGDFQISNHELRNKILVTRPKDKVSPKNKANSSGISTESCRKTEDMSSSPLYRNREGGLVEIRENLLESNGNFLKNSLNSQYRDRRGSKNQGSISIFRTKLTSQQFPSEEEIEEFFSAAEKDSQKRFRERYNFDVLEDIPLAGRYEWVTI